MDDPESKLNSIVGSAIRGLVESGASDESVGAFAHRHRTQVAQLLGIEKKPPTVEADLQAVIAGAVAQALQVAGLIGPGRVNAAERVYVLVGGRRTSLTIDRAVLRRLTQGAGRPSANELIQTYANQVPTGTKNRSKWVQDQLVAYVAMQGVQVATDARH